MIRRLFEILLVFVIGSFQVAAQVVVQNEMKHFTVTFHGQWDTIPNLRMVRYVKKVYRQVNSLLGNMKNWLKALILLTVTGLLVYWFLRWHMTSIVIAKLKLQRCYQNTGLLKRKWLSQE